MPVFYKGNLKFKNPPKKEGFNAGREFFKRYYGCDPFVLPDGMLPPTASARTVPFLVSSSSLRHLDRPNWIRNLERESDEEETNDLYMLLMAEEMEKLFECKVEFERFQPNISDYKSLGILTEHDKWSFSKFQSGSRAAGRDRITGAGNIPAPTSNPEALKEALAELDALIGLEPVKQQIHDIVAVVQNRGAQNLPCLHMLFTGNPGTGKTIVARKLGQILAALGVTSSEGRFIEADRSSLVGEFVGHTAQKTKKVISEAMGGILFIDEAYSLGLYASDLGAGPEGMGGRRDFGPEAIDALVKEMEDRRHDFVCILAGYTHEMEAMVSINPGLRDRIGFKIEFPDYTADELGQIFEKMVSDKGYSLETAARWLALDNIETIKRSKGQNFGNARLIRKLAERTIFKQNVRTGGYDICAEDVQNAFEDMDLAALRQNHAQPFGFCA